MLDTTTLLLIALLGQGPPGAAGPSAPLAAAEIEFFEKRVRPVLVERCFACHSTRAKKVEAGLLLDSREAVLRGGDSGPAAQPGNVEQSRLIEAVRYRSEALQMPPTGKLPDREIEVLQEWVQRGLPFPFSEATIATRRTIDLIEGRKHWAFLPLFAQRLVAQPSPETDREQARGRRIDAFVQARQSEQGLPGSAPANRRVLIRRASFNLLGLPPDRAEVAQFVDDPAPDAYARLIDRYLASPQYGQRWARYWLDLARYCDVAESWREGESQAWVYRDWVINALNADMPYDDFIRRQLAADLLPDAMPADNAALGFLGLSPSYWKELKLDHKVIQQVVAEEWEERIEAISGTFLGLTVACARCHDHKFDPVTTHDYYALAGVLASIRLEDRSLIADDLAATAKAARAKVKQLQQQLDKLAKAKEQTPEAATQQAELRREIDELKRTPHFDTPVAAGISDASIAVLPDGQHRTKIEYRPGESQDVALHIRGNAANPGPVVARRFLAVLSRDPEARFRQGSGRLELAEAIVNESAPLVARVIVNRVWMHHFGRGLVATPSNFGTTGDRPSHPELLDDLASRFVAHGWSLKWLHREIMLSTTYQQASYRDPLQHAKDPENVWLWRMTPRRLDVETWRDAILAATGRLDVSLGGAPVDLAKPENQRRTIYGQIKRRELTDLLRLHDFPDPVAHSAARIATTTPLQQLFTLNSPLMHHWSTALADRLRRDSPAETDARIDWLFQTVLGRSADAAETGLAREFLAAATHGEVSADEAWRQYCHVLLASNELLYVE